MRISAKQSGQHSVPLHIALKFMTPDMANNLADIIQTTT